ncbi:MAG: GumC family protein [Candidatus Krumholzibacteriia bacterium]
MGPRDVVFVLFRRRWIILAISLPIILIGGASLLGRTGTYTAASRVLVELLNVDQPRWNVTGRTIDFDREMSTFLNTAMSVSVADRAAVALADSLPVIRKVDSKLADLKEGPEFRDLLLNGLDVNVVGESNILEFRHTAENPRVALMAVGAMRNAFIQFENFGRRNPGAVAYYSEQIATVRASIDSLLAVRGGILSRTGYTSLEDEMRYSVGSAADTEAQLRKVQVEREQLEAEYTLLKGYLTRDPRDFPAGQDESRASTLVGWRDQVAKHEDALNSTLTVHTDDSLPVRRQRELLEASLKRLREEEVAYTESVHLSLEASRQRERTLQAQMSTIRSDNSRLPDVYQRVSMLDSDIKSLRDLLTDLQAKWGEVRMSEMADDRVSKIVVLTEPELITVLAEGKSMVYLAIVVLFAIALGLAGAFVQEGLDHRIYAPRDIEDNLELPVFTSVTRTD